MAGEWSDVTPTDSPICEGGSRESGGWAEGEEEGDNPIGQEPQSGQPALTLSPPRVPVVAAAD